MDEEALLEEAKTCFETVLQEGGQVSNVDIQLMLATTHRCRDILQQLTDRETDDTYTVLYKQLLENVESHGSILEAKINQLNGQQAIPTVTSDTECQTTDVPGAQQQDVGNNQEQQRRSAIQDTIVDKGGVTFKDIAGLLEAKQALTEAIIMPLQFPQLFTGCIKPWKRILLYGPPGTGKSRIAQAISAEINSTFYSVSSSDIVSSWVGESEKLIKELFQHATAQNGRSVIFIDEIDSICRQRSSREEEHTRRIKTELLKQMEGADNSNSSDKIFLLCATNCPWELDSAFLRRFQKRIFIPLPDRDARLELIKIHTKNNVLQLTAAEWSSIAEKTDGYSGSDIANMTLGAMFGPIRDLQTAVHWCSTAVKEDPKRSLGHTGLTIMLFPLFHVLPEGKFTPCSADNNGALSAKLTDLPPDKIFPRQVALADFMKSLQTHRKTVSDSELQKFKDFTSDFGEQG